jgi:multiple antibiotic resistance protein
MAVEFLVVFIPMFIVIDPFGVLPIYLALTGGMTQRDRGRTLKLALVFSTALLVAFALVGKAILDYLSVSIDALKITGGLLLLVIGVMMLYEGDAPRARKGKEEEPDGLTHSPEDVAFVPLGTPMLAGPGAISVVIILTGTAADIPLVVAALLLTMTFVALLLWKAGLLYKIIGKAGTRALTRVMGLITSAYAVQMILDGISSYVMSII